jgi:hypothetical protein
MHQTLTESLQLQSIQDLLRSTQLLATDELIIEALSVSLMARRPRNAILTASGKNQKPKIFRFGLNLPRGINELQS